MTVSRQIGKQKATVQKLSCRVCGTVLNPKPRIKTPTGYLCLDCWASEMGSYVEEHPIC